MYHIFLCIIVSCFFLSCRQKEKPQISFYHWKSKYHPAATEKAAIVTNSVSALYVRYFDVLAENGTPKPVSVLRFEEIPSEKIIPVVFIRNDVFKKIEKSANDSLVNRVAALVREIHRSTADSLEEVQFDCDWTQSTKDSYFSFLKLFSEKVKLKISATIRLHQVKYSHKAGVPPVNRGLLMYYNMGNISAGNSNSIYDQKQAAKYTGWLKSYALPLDIALPVFSWAIQCRENEVVALLNKVNENHFLKDSNFVPLPDANFKVKNSCFKDGYYFAMNDIVKVESINEKQLLEMADHLQQQMKQIPEKIIFYDLDSLNLTRYDKTIFKQISDHFY